MKKFKEQYEIYKNFTEEVIEYYISNMYCQDKLKNAMAYSLRAGGKRLRPVMFMAALDMFGIDYKKYKGFAFALESIHTYSLIHDDLPAMDNDDYRRGQLSNHKVFGEDMAILAGDGLLSYAMEVLFCNIDDKNTFLAGKELAILSGYSGMINGQAYDITSENKIIPETEKESLLKIIEENKTGKLLTAPLTMASLIAGGKFYEELKEVGRLTGILFQATDDLLDIHGTFENMGKTLGKDADENKLTAISVYGEKTTEKLVDDTFMSIINILKNIDNNSFFNDFYIAVKNRKN